MGIPVETARDICTFALKEAGVLGVGQTALSEDINDTFKLLNRMLAQWQRKRYVVPSLYDLGAIANGAKSNPIGPGQFWNAQRPDKIQAAYFIQNIAGAGPNTVSFPLTQIASYENYSEISLKQLPSWPQFFFYDNAFPFGNVFIWPVPDATYEVHLILKGPIGFTTEIKTGKISTPGAAYTNGVYPNVPLTNLTSFGSGTIATVAVAGRIVTAVAITNAGTGYKINDQLTASSALIGGTGTGFIYTVTDVIDDLNAVMNMPDEYYEAIHYNLVLRVMSMYNYPADPFRSALAKGALNTIRIANAQIPALSMPSSLRNRRGGKGFYIFNADA